MNEIDAYKKHIHLPTSKPDVAQEVMRYLQIAYSLKEYDKFKKAIYNIIDYVKIEESQEAAKFAQLLMFMYENVETVDTVKMNRLLQTVIDIFEK